MTGSIAAYKGRPACLPADETALRCSCADDARNAAKFISPLTFETLTGNRISTDTFDRNFEYNVEHVALAKRADLVLIAPLYRQT